MSRRRSSGGAGWLYGLILALVIWLIHRVDRSVRDENMVDADPITDHARAVTPRWRVRRNRRDFVLAHLALGYTG
jgi:hypothetical protein